VVGTDGSDTSLRAVDHAAAFAAENNAKLIIAMAHLSSVDRGGWGRAARPDRVIDLGPGVPDAEVALGSEGDYKMHGRAGPHICDPAGGQRPRQRRGGAGPSRLLLVPGPAPL
jgi:hypothetical protein